MNELIKKCGTCRFRIDDQWVRLPNGIVEPIDRMRSVFQHLGPDGFRLIFYVK